jgi:predicted secreted hydrolase
VAAVGDDWRRYPFELVAGDAQFQFPAAEAEHPDYESDTWFLAGELTGEPTGRRFAFLTIFNKNRPGHTVVADFYTFALFDLDHGTYATFTDYDMPPASLRPGATPKLSSAVGQLDMAYQSAAGTASWRTSRDEREQLVPYTYDVEFVGTGRAGDAMRLRLHITPTRAPVPVGASAWNGKIACFGQAGTYSYFQTGMAMSGTLRWGPVEEAVGGNAGHVDRQWFPRYAGGGGTGGDPRACAHEWRTINLDNGIDLSIWRQFDRTSHNALQPFSGATTSPTASEPEYADDIEVAVASYVRWPQTVSTLIPPLSEARYMPDRHRLTSRKLGLDLEGEPLVAAPAHALPIEYMEGPYRYHGSMRGRPVSGFAFYERSIAMYRDWELVEVLAAAGGNAAVVAEVRELIGADRRDEAIACLEKADAATAQVTEIITDLVTALR